MFGRYVFKSLKREYLKKDSCFIDKPPYPCLYNRFKRNGVDNGD